MSLLVTSVRISFWWDFVVNPCFWWGRCTTQSWMETSGLWRVFLRERQGMDQTCPVMTDGPWTPTEWATYSLYENTTGYFKPRHVELWDRSRLFIAVSASQAAVNCLIMKNAYVTALASTCSSAVRECVEQTRSLC